MGMPIIRPSRATRQQSITDIIESVALEQTALSHILNAEGEKLQKALDYCATINYSRENHLEEYDFVYYGEKQATGINEQGYAFVVFDLKDTITGIHTGAYCFDLNNYIQVGDHYNQILLKGSNAITETNANKIRNILTKSFPYVPIETVRTLSGISTLTVPEAVTATQLAIWKLTNNFSMTHSNANVMALYNWYIALPPIDVIINPAKINITAQPISCDHGCSVRFLFSTDGYNSDGSPVSLEYAFDKDIVAIYGAMINEELSGSTKIVTASNLPQGANFTIVITGVQSLDNDAYQYVNSQDLVGLFAQTNYMIASCYYLCKEKCCYDILKVNQSVNRMVNSVTTLEMVLQSKLDLFHDCLCEDNHHHHNIC